MSNLTFRRMLAYILDIFFILLLTGMISQINFINPEIDEYSKWYEKYSDSIIDKKIINIKSDEVIDYAYQLNKHGQVYYIIDILVYVGYFVFFQKYNKGQTLGKKITKIKVVGKGNKPVKNQQLFLRSLLIYGIISHLSVLLTINLVSKSLYLSINNAVSFISGLIFWACAFVFIFRKDNLGLHDLLFKTEVIDEKNNLIIKNKH